MAGKRKQDIEKLMPEHRITTQDLMVPLELLVTGYLDEAMKACRILDIVPPDPAKPWGRMINSSYGRSNMLADLASRHGNNPPDNVVRMIDFVNGRTTSRKAA